jgi:hypothetical protein
MAVFWGKIVFIIAVLMGVPLGINSSFELIEALTETLLEISSILFAVVGIWVCVLNPTALLKKPLLEKIDAQEELSYNFLSVLIRCGWCLSVVIVLEFLVKIKPVLPLFLLPACLRIVIKIVVVCLLTYIYAMQAFVAIDILLPAFDVKSYMKVRNDKERRREQAKPTISCYPTDDEQK